MSDRKNDHIKEIQTQFDGHQRLKDALNNSIQLLAKELYSKDTHFVFELIQNAEDNDYGDAEPWLYFRLLNDDPTNTPSSTGALIIQNNEIGFSSNNVDAICSVGKTTKNKIEGYIGEKGIGFKSVFRITSNPHIFSNGYRFCLPETDEETGLKYIVPRWIERDLKEIDSHSTNIILPLDKNEYSYQKIEEMLRDIEPETILFLSKLKEIRIQTDSGDSLVIIKDDSKAPLVQILIEGQKQGERYSKVSEFLQYSEVFDKPTDIMHEKRLGIDKRIVLIAFPIDDNHESAGKIFAYLPVRSDTGLPFLINADFILPSSREDILKVKWNEWLMKCAAELLANSLSLLKEQGRLTVELLQAIARRMLEIKESSVFYPFVTPIRDVLINKELLPTDDGNFVVAGCARLARGAELRSLLQQDQLCLLFKSINSIKWLSHDISQDRTPELRSYIMKELDIEEITPEVFVRNLTVEFLKNQTDDWMISFYRFVASLNHLWKPWNGPLKFKPFIRLQNNTHVSPFRDDSSPNSYLTNERDELTSFPTVKFEISQHEDIFRFFRELGIPELDIVEEVIEIILPKYSSTVSIAEHRRDIEKIVRAYNTDSQEKKSRLRKKLQETPFVQTSALVKNTQSYHKPEDSYLIDDELLEYFSGYSDAHFISSDYDKSECDLLMDVGVQRSVKIVYRKPDPWGYIIIKDIDGEHERGLNGFDPEIKIEGFKNALNIRTNKMSQFIWNKIVIPYAKYIHGIVERSTHKKFLTKESIPQFSKYFGKLLMENDWLPTPNGEYKKPSELGLEDLPVGFQRDEKLAEQLGMKKNLITKLAEQVGVRAEDIEFIKQHEDAFQKWKITIIHPSLPKRQVPDPDRRRNGILLHRVNAPSKESVLRERSIQPDANNIIHEARAYLRGMHTNEDEQLICQCCQCVMPFKINHMYYFEVVQCIRGLDRHYYENRLALCPTCAAMYQHARTTDDNEVRRRIVEKNAADTVPSVLVPVTLTGQEYQLHFVGVHWFDLKTVLNS